MNCAESEKDAGREASPGKIDPKLPMLAIAWLTQGIQLGVASPSISVLENVGRWPS